MRKLLALLGTVAITSSTVGLLTDSVSITKSTTSLKTESKKMMAMSELTTDSNVETKANEFTTMEISTLDQESQQWDYAKIDKILKHSLEYHHHQLSINKKKLDMKSLPSEVSEHLDEALEKLNDAVDQGVVQVEVENNKVELIYPDNNGIMKTNDVGDDDVFYYDDANTMRAESAYMWFTKYGPKPWWKFWKWGAYLHFSESAVVGAAIACVIAKAVNLHSLFKDVKEINGAIQEINSARLVGNITKVNKIFNTILGKIPGLSLEYLGDVFETIASLTMVVNFIITFYSGGLFKAICEIVLGIIGLVTEKIVETDRGKGVKWQLVCYIIPGHFSPE